MSKHFFTEYVDKKDKVEDIGRFTFNLETAAILDATAVGTTGSVQAQ